MSADYGNKCVKCFELLAAVEDDEIISDMADAVEALISSSRPAPAGSLAHRRPDGREVVKARGAT